MMHLPAQIERARRGAKRMAAVAKAKSWTWRDIPSWWPVITAIILAVFAAAQVDARIQSAEAVNAAQDARLATVEKTLNEMAVTTGRVDQRTIEMKSTLDRMADKRG